MVECGKDEAAGRSVGSAPHPYPVGENHGRRPVPPLLGESRPFKAALRAAEAFRTNGHRHLLVTGEAGAGKTAMARHLHYTSHTREAPLLVLDCQHASPEILARELFGVGRVPGARQEVPGLLRLAGLGTLLLERVHTAPSELQDRVALALARGEAEEVGGGEPFPVDCRVVVEAPHDGRDGGRSRGLTPRLLEQLGPHRISLPPLRQRREDVPALARFFLREDGGVEVHEEEGISRELLKAFEGYHWPGNVRELRHAIRTGLARSRDLPLTKEDVRVQCRWLRPMDRGEDGEMPAIRVPPEGRSLAEVEEELVRITLKLTGGNRSAASRILGVSRPTLSRKVKKYGIPVPGSR